MTRVLTTRSVWGRWTSGFVHEFCLGVASLVWERWTNGFDHEVVVEIAASNICIEQQIMFL